MKFLFVLATVFAVAFAQFGEQNESDPVPTTDYPLEPEVSADEPANEESIQEVPVEVEPVKEVIVEEPAKVEAVEVLLPVSSSEAPVVSSKAPIVVPSKEKPVPLVRSEFRPVSTEAPTPVPVVRSEFRPVRPVPTSAPAPRFAFSDAPVTQAPTTRYYVPSSAAPLPTAFIKSIAAVSTSDRMAKTNQEINEINPNGEYVHGFQSDNGISQEAQGTLRNIDGNPPSQTLVVTGSFSWTGNNGEPVVVKYIADENGYQPESAALPTPPPIPPQIARAVEYLRKIYAERERQQK